MANHRKCMFTQRPILPNEKDSVQILIAELDKDGRTTGKVKMVDVCGSIRKTGEIDALLTETEL